MTAFDDLNTFARSFRRNLWRQSGKFHRTRLLVSGKYIETSKRKARA